ncbi:MAG: glycosyltransferase family 4 protein [candidate division WOR-3 bacterium]|nr:glycosyltransferase family 4 protein [candidate division WOR-3 bacterium]
MKTYLIDPRNTTKPYNFCFLSGLKKKKYPFTFFGHIPNFWGKYSPVKENNLFLPLSRGIFENKRAQRFIANQTQTAEMFFGHLRLHARLKKGPILHFLWFTAPSIEQYIIPRLNKARLLHTAHNLLPHRERAGDYEKFKKLYSFMECVVVHDKETKKRFKKMFKLPTSVKVIPHGNLEDFYNTFDETGDYESEELYSKTFIGLKRPIFLFIGSIKPYKGFDILLDAVKELNNKGYKYSLVVKDRRKKELKNLYYLPIELPYSKLGLIYRNVDAVLLPHTKLSQSVTLFEAGYFEKPVIVSSVGGLKETVRNGKDGFIFTKEDPKSLAEKMERFIQSSSKEISNLGKNFKEHLVEEYSWDRITEKWIKIYLGNSQP